MFDEIRERVYKANVLLKDSNLVTLTWGNVSEIDRQKGIIVIKPSGVDYAEMRAEDMVVTDLDGNIKSLVGIGKRENTVVLECENFSQKLNVKPNEQYVFDGNMLVFDRQIPFDYMAE